MQVYFDLGNGTDYIYHGSTKFVGIHNEDVLTLSKQEQLAYQTEAVEKIYPEYYIIRVNQFDGVAKNTLDEWINFLKNEKVSAGTHAKGLIEASEKLDVLKMSRDERRAYDIYISNWRDQESIWESNYVAGELAGEANKEAYANQKIEEKSIEMARKCLKKGLSIQEIAELTDLDESKILQLNAE